MLCSVTDVLCLSVCLVFNKKVNKNAIETKLIPASFDLFIFISMGNGSSLP